MGPGKLKECNAMRMNGSLTPTNCNALILIMFRVAQLSHPMMLNSAADNHDMGSKLVL